MRPKAPPVYKWFGTAEHQSGRILLWNNYVVPQWVRSDGGVVFVRRQVDRAAATPTPHNLGRH